MLIVLKKSFVKQYQKLQKASQSKIDNTLRLFEKNPHDPQLKNHALTGKLTGKRSISAGFDLRIVFELEGNYMIVTMLSVGTHNQVY
ncbi:type II toxin-antitoxin system mRNA interferase toxin, RelE/StbE family [Candidatus Peregrinibacteria bacterium]|nr:type II toxin-antitoxin system mRNA interferase toxin, RelE/StbE family [Candidatus Peregrinibacteria bacterium]